MKIIKILTSILFLYVLVLAIYGHYYGWAAAILITHDLDFIYPITIFEIWQNGLVAGRAFLTIPGHFDIPELIWLYAPNNSDHYVWNSKVFGLIVSAILIYGFNVLLREISTIILKLKRKKYNPYEPSSCQ